jgi:uncharacterized membrane protein
MKKEQTLLDQKPGRPFGVTLAIIVTVVFFSLIPLIAVGMRFAIETYISQGSSGANGVLGSNSADALTDADTIIQMAISIGFLIVAFFAWRGRPRFMRFVLMLSTLAISAILLYQSFQSFQSNRLEGGSADAFIQFLRQGEIFLLVAIPLYVTWYLNRAPARAFYRGYYLQEDLDAMDDD